MRLEPKLGSAERAFLTKASKIANGPTGTEEEQHSHLRMLQNQFEKNRTVTWLAPDEQLVANFALRVIQYSRALANVSIDMNPRGLPAWPRSIAGLVDIGPRNPVEILDVCGGLGQASVAFALACASERSNISIRARVWEHPNLLTRAKPIVTALRPIVDDLMSAFGVRFVKEYHPFDLAEPNLVTTSPAGAAPDVILQFHAARAIRGCRPTWTSSQHANWLDSLNGAAHIIIHEVLPADYFNCEFEEHRKVRRWANGLRDHLAGPGQPIIDRAIIALRAISGGRNPAGYTGVLTVAASCFLRPGVLASESARLFMTEVNTAIEAASSNPAHLAAIPSGLIQVAIQGAIVSGDTKSAERCLIAAWPRLSELGRRDPYLRVIAGRACLLTGRPAKALELLMQGDCGKLGAHEAFWLGVTHLALGSEERALGAMLFAFLRRRRALIRVPTYRRLLTAAGTIGWGTTSGLFLLWLKFIRVSGARLPAGALFVGFGFLWLYYAAATLFGLWSGSHGRKGKMPA